MMATTSTNNGLVNSGLLGPLGVFTAAPVRTPFDDQDTPASGETSRVNQYATRAGDLDRVRSSRGHMAYAVAVTGAQSTAAAYITGRSPNSAQEGSGIVKDTVTDIKTGQTVTRAARVT